MGEFNEMREILGKLPRGERVEKTIFDAGARGYFENPTTDLLAFFASSDDKPHGFAGDLIKVLLSFCEGEKPVSIGTVTAEREVVTKQGGRIDLLLDSSDWVLAIENKINHGLGNDLKDYASFIEDHFKCKRQKFYIILAPSKFPVIYPWISVTYSQLLSGIKECFDYEKNISKEIFERDGKWSFFFKDFLLHLKNISEPYKMDEGTQEFVKDHFKKLKEASDLRKSFINSLQNRLRKDLSDQLSFELQTTLRNWCGGDVPALRYRLAEWANDSDVVLCLHCEGERLKPSVRLYAEVKGVDNERRHILGENSGGKLSKGKGFWEESSKTIMVWEEFLETYDYERIKEKLREKIMLLNQFEKTRAAE